MKIVYERKKCIGCGSCVAVAPKFFDFAEDGKANLKNSKDKNGMFIVEINKEDFEALKEVPDVCPMKIIKIEK